MNTIKSDNSNSTITTDYDDFTNKVEVSITNSAGGKTVHLAPDKVDHLITLLSEFKNDIV
jgi:hypothetical protein